MFNLIQSVQDIETFEDEPEFDDIVKQLKDMSGSDIVAAEILDVLDEDEVVDWASDKQPHIVIKLESMELRSKLEEFLEKEIFPNYNDQTSENSNLF